MQLARARIKSESENKKKVEDRKDERTRMSGTQQSEMIEQRQNNLLPKNFESKGNDTLSGGFGLGQFDPK